MSIRDFCILSQKAKTMRTSEEFTTSLQNLKATKKYVSNAMLKNNVRSLTVNDSVCVCLQYSKKRPRINSVSDFIEFTKNLEPELVDVPFEKITKQIISIVRNRLDMVSETKETPRMVIKKTIKPSEGLPRELETIVSVFRDAHEKHKMLADGLKQVRGMAKNAEEQVGHTLDQPLVVQMQHGNDVKHFKVERKITSSSRVGLRELMRELRYCLQTLKSRDTISEHIKLCLTERFEHRVSTTEHIHMKVVK